MVDESVVITAKNYLQRLEEQEVPVRFGVIFGSQVGGKPDAWSDIDLLVVSPRFEGERQRKDINLLWRTAARTDSRIEPVPVGLLQFDSDDSSAIIEIARRAGQRVYLAN